MYAGNTRGISSALPAFDGWGDDGGGVGKANPIGYTNPSDQHDTSLFPAVNV